MNGSDADRHNQKEPGLSPGPENVRFGHTHTCKTNNAVEYASGLPRQDPHYLKQHTKPIRDHKLCSLGKKRK